MVLPCRKIYILWVKRINLFCLLVLCSPTGKPFLPCLLLEFRATIFTLKYRIYPEVILALNMRQRSTLNIVACLHTIFWIIHHFPTNLSYTDRNTDLCVGLCSNCSLRSISRLLPSLRLSGALLPPSSCLYHSVGCLHSRNVSWAT